MGKPRVWLELYQKAVSDSPIDCEWLKLNPLALEMKDGLGETVLHYLAVENNPDGIKKLIAVGATVNTQNVFGNTPIMESSQLGYRNIIALLYSSGADINIKNKKGNDIFEHLEEYNKQKMIEYLKNLKKQSR